MESQSPLYSSPSLNLFLHFYKPRKLLLSEHFREEKVAMFTGSASTIVGLALREGTTAAMTPRALRIAGSDHGQY